MTDIDSRAEAKHVPIGEQSCFRHLVVGTDGSEGAHRALQWAARVAATNDAEVLAVHVLTYNHQALRDITLDTM